MVIFTDLAPSGIDFFLFRPNPPDLVWGDIFHGFTALFIGPNPPQDGLLPSTVLPSICCSRGSTGRCTSSERLHNQSKATNHCTIVSLYLQMKNRRPTRRLEWRCGRTRRLATCWQSSNIRPKRQRAWRAMEIVTLRDRCPSRFSRRHRQWQTNRTASFQTQSVPGYTQFAVCTERPTVFYTDSVARPIKITASGRTESPKWWSIFAKTNHI